MLVSHSFVYAKSLRQQADSAYQIGHFAEAARLYTTLSDSIQEAEVYYNLGNAEFQLRRYPQSILAYKRALRLSPDHNDARYNLTIAQKHVNDKFGDPKEMFYTTLLRNWVTTSSVHHWVTYSFLYFVLFFVGLSCYVIADKTLYKKMGFFAMLAFVVLFATSTAFAWYQRHSFYHNSEAIIFADESFLHDSPSGSSAQKRTIHSGTIISIMNSDTKDWLLIKLPDGEECWMKDEGYERVMR